MKYSCLMLLLFMLLIVMSCDSIKSNGPTRPLENSPVNLGIKINSVNTNCTVPLNKLCLRLSAIDAQIIYDTVFLEEDEDYIMNKYYDLKPFRKWKVDAIIIDKNDSVSHSGTMEFYVDEWMDNFVLIMEPNFTRLTAAFFPLSRYSHSYGEIERCELVIDNQVVASIPVDPSASEDTVELHYNYVSLNVSHKITLNVYGDFLRNPCLLFTGSITRQFDKWSSDEPITLPLKWVGPLTVPIQIEVAIFYQQQRINGEIEGPQF